MFAERWKKSLIGLLLLALTIIILIQQDGLFFLSQIPSKVEYKYHFWRATQSETCSQNAPSWLKNVTKTTREWNIPAGQVAFLSSEGELFHCEYGFRDGLDGNEPVTAETRFKFASISKIFTSEAILDLVRSQKLALSDLILPKLELGSNLPFQDIRIEKITIEDLLTHTGGFDRDKSWDPMFMIKKLVWCPQALEKLSSSKLDFDPGTERHYSNLGYCLLGEVISKVVDKPFPKYMEQHFNFSKYGFRYAQNSKFFPDEVAYYFLGDDIPNYMNVFAFDSLQSSAGLTGSASNLVKVADEISKQPEPNILTPDQRKSCDREKYLDCYALGTFLYYLPQEEETVYIRNGSLPGFTGTLVISPKFGIAAFLGNSRNVNNGKQAAQSIENIIAKGLVTGN